MPLITPSSLSTILLAAYVYLSISDVGLICGLRYAWLLLLLPFGICAGFVHFDEPAKILLNVTLLAVHTLCKATAAVYLLIVHVLYHLSRGSDAALQFFIDVACWDPTGRLRPLLFRTKLIVRSGVSVGTAFHRTIVSTVELLVLVLLCLPHISARLYEGFKIASIQFVNAILTALQCFHLVAGLLVVSVGTLFTDLVAPFMAILRFIIALSLYISVNISILVAIFQPILRPVLVPVFRPLSFCMRIMMSLVSGISTVMFRHLVNLSCCIMVRIIREDRPEGSSKSLESASECSSTVRPTQDSTSPNITTDTLDTVASRRASDAAAVFLTVYSNVSACIILYAVLSTRIQPTSQPHHKPCMFPPGNSSILPSASSEDNLHQYRLAAVVPSTLNLVDASSSALPSRLTQPVQEHAQKATSSSVHATTVHHMVTGTHEPASRRRQASRRALLGTHPTPGPSVPPSSTSTTLVASESDSDADPLELGPVEEPSSPDHAGRVESADEDARRKAVEAVLELARESPAYKAVVVKWLASERRRLVSQGRLCRRPGGSKPRRYGTYLHNSSTFSPSPETVGTSANPPSDRGVACK
ncbi:uncharacterized protein BXZ73DRAFT_83034 [Epithele typhae]|uniref:uncharacterized protein n=1 Tax=Epithele typhae TaxID=378194 RepID=UPI0020079842|nr:uncharacterized protein BXZ73DRAFT_83034 [Epithele typhae]KAH9910994.1 hypothetical protein BXZ73DRAFT_83034 [Epithele typhae]